MYEIYIFIYDVSHMHIGFLLYISKTFGKSKELGKRQKCGKRQGMWQMIRNVVNDKECGNLPTYFTYKLRRRQGM